MSMFSENLKCLFPDMPFPKMPLFRATVDEDDEWSGTQYANRSIANKNRRKKVEETIIADRVARNGKTLKVSCQLRAEPKNDIRKSARIRRPKSLDYLDVIKMKPSETLEEAKEDDGQEIKTDIEIKEEPLDAVPPLLPAVFLDSKEIKTEADIKEPLCDPIDGQENKTEVEKHLKFLDDHTYCANILSDRLKQGTNTECVLDSRCWKIFGEDLDDSEISDEDFDELEILDEDSDELDPLDVKIERSSMSHQSSLIHMEYSSESWNGLDIVKNPVSEHLDDNENETEIKESVDTDDEWEGAQSIGQIVERAKKKKELLIGWLGIKMKPTETLKEDDDQEIKSKIEIKYDMIHPLDEFEI